MIEKENKIVYEMNGEEIGVVEYKKIDENTIDIYHTYVDPDYQGKKIASKLVEELFKKLQKENKKAILSCSYVANWMEKHPEYSNLCK
ncbi:MAG TPA: N-acetyltransferase [Candidatus Faecimonas gallistercoris]|nr:N-acetyltransferase [Candidatus Faecimonas gallistercoris]